MHGRDLARQAAEQLEANGFLVEREVRVELGGSDRFYADVVAWGGDADGDLVRDVVVETKASVRVHLGAALAQLSRVAAIVGARRAFLFDGEWLEVDATFTKAVPTTCPKPVLAPGKARVPASLVAQQVWNIRNDLRAKGRAPGLESIEAVLDAAAPNSATVLSRLMGSVDARLTLASLVAAEDNLGIPPELALSMARLLDPVDGWTVLDPVCRLGTTFWATAAVAARKRARVTFRGWEPRHDVAALTRRLGAFSGTDVSVDLGGISEILEQATLADGIVSAFPLGVRLGEQVDLASGGKTREADVALLDRIQTWLKPGGRAVLAVAPRLLFAESARGLRERLAQTMRVTAVIELPPGVLNGTNIRLAVVVIENRPPSQTLVARLTDDWRVQLSSDGPFLATYRQHLTAGTG